MVDLIADPGLLSADQLVTVWNGAAPFGNSD